MAERTFIILKPDCVQRGLSGEVIKRFESKGLKIVGLKMVLVTSEKAAYHYAEHKEKPFFKELVDFITSSPVIVMVLEGDDAIKMARKLSGATKAIDAEPGTIRGDFVLHTGQNIVHTSDSPESAKREIDNFFKSDEIVEYSRNIDKWI